jgi:hypothetical protein
MHKPMISRTAPTGFSFELADLVLLQGWADFHGMQLTVELDHCVEGDEYEEVVALYTADNRLRRWILWRSANGIVVQPLIGRSIHFGCVADAIEALVPTGA